ncbi:MAG: hypothetical protein K8U03_26700 [Planctomycetia bacterium]|nr:hypothetical protein [Planctomycetia bacterium]
MKWLRQRKHRLLLAVLVLALLAQPVATGRTEIFGFLILLAVFLTVFERRVQHVVGIVLGLLTIATNTLGIFGPESHRDHYFIAYHILIISFMGFAVATILADIFSSERIQLDHVIGAFSGFILAALAWGNLYLLIYLLQPDAFHVEPQHVSHLNDLELRRFLFNHLSFASLTSLDHDGIAPLAPFVRTLQWFEALFGQFYFAVFIGQLVGLTMVGANAAKNSPTKDAPSKEEPSKDSPRPTQE